MAENIETTLAFWYLAVMAVAAGVAMIAMRHPVHVAISLVVVIFHVAGLFVILGSGFLAVAQIAIYGGAIVVLFLFTLMMLDLRLLPGERVTHRQFWLGIPLALTLAVEAVVIGIGTPEISPSIKGAFPPSTVSELGGSAHALAVALFTDYTLPFLATSVMLTAATIGAIVLARRVEAAEHPDGLHVSNVSKDPSTSALAEQQSAVGITVEEPPQ